MKNTEIIEIESLFKPSEDEICNATDNLEKYLDLVQNNNRKFNDNNDDAITGNYSNLSLKRTILIDKKIVEADFTNAALTGSVFSEVNFSKVKFDEANLQYCQFIHILWDSIEVHSTNLSFSNYYNATFINVNFKGSTIAEILFENCKFENCVFTSSMLENSIFKNCLFFNVKFINTNIEYMEFVNCKYNNVCFPMSQIHYVFGLMQALLDVKNDIKLSADTRIIDLQEYKELTKSFLIYYASINEYFPMANIYLASELPDIAYQCIYKGVQKAIAQRNFRMLKFFCKQAKKGKLFSYHQLKKLYLSIETEIRKYKLNVYEQRSLVYNIGEIRSILLESIDGLPTARIELQTNIDSSETDKIANFINYIDTVISNSCTKKISHIEYRHNSDANFVAYISAHYLEILLTIYMLLKFSNKAVGEIQEKILNHQKIQLNRLKIKDKKAEKNEEKILKDNNIEYSVQYIINHSEITNDDSEINIYI